MSTPSNRWYPGLEGIANPKSAFETQTAQAMRQVLDYTYANRDSLAGLQASAAANSGEASSSSSNWWNQPYAADVFSATAASTSITVTWSRYKIAPTSYASRKTPYLNVPNGTLTASGLSGSTNYWFYPAYDTRSGQITFAVDPSLVVAGSVAHTGPSAVALMKASSGGLIPLSAQGFQAKTGAGALTGLGGGLLHGSAV